MRGEELCWDYYWCVTLTGPWTTAMATTTTTILSKYKIIFVRCGVRRRLLEINKFDTFTIFLLEKKMNGTGSMCLSLLTRWEGKLNGERANEKCYATLAYVELSMCWYDDECKWIFNFITFKTIPLFLPIASSQWRRSQGTRVRYAHQLIFKLNRKCVRFACQLTWEHFRSH